MASNDPAELKRETEEAVAAVAKLQAEFVKVTAQLAAIDQSDPFANFTGEVDSLNYQIANLTKALATAVKEAEALTTSFDLSQAAQSMAELQKQGQIEMELFSKQLKEKQAAEEAAAKQAAKAAKVLADQQEKDRADMYASASKIAAAYFAEEEKLAAQAAKAAKVLADQQEKDRTDQYAAAAKVAKAYFDELAKEEAAAKAQAAKEVIRLQKEIAKAMAEAVAQQEADAAKLAKEVEALAKETAKKQKQEWADLIETRKTLDAQAKKNIQEPAAAAKASAASSAAAGGGGADIAGAAVSAISGLAGAAVGAAMAVKGLADQAAAYVNFSDPAAVLLMTQAMEDLQAAIGSGLSPVVNAMTVVLDQANAAVTAFEPIINAISAQLSGTFVDMAKEAIALGEAFADLALSEIIPLVVVVQQLWEAGKPLVASLVDLTKQFAAFNLDLFLNAFEAAQPVINFFVERLSDAAKGLAFMARVIAIFIEAARTGRIDRIGSRIGEAVTNFNAQPGPRQPAGGITVAARPATQISSEEIGAQARMAAFGGRSIAEQQLDQAREQTGLLNRLLDNTRPRPAPVQIDVANV